MKKTLKIKLKECTGIRDLYNGYAEVITNNEYDGIYSITYIKKLLKEQGRNYKKLLLY